MSDTEDRFDRERNRAIEDLQRNTVLSFYVGMVLDETDGQAIEYQLQTDSDDPQTLNNVNLVHLAMVLSVIAEDADATLEEVAEAAVERARAENLPQQV